MNEIQSRIKLPEKIYNIKDTKKRYVVIYGGRGGGKSISVGYLFLTKALEESALFLCTRQVQNTITDSVYGVLVDNINELGWEQYFDIKKTEIVSVTGSRFIFKGLQKNIKEIKSTHKIKYVWMEEADGTTKIAWDLLDPTIRETGAQIWIIYNPDNDDAPIHQEFVVRGHPECELVNINYWDNPFFPDVLRKLMEYDKKYNYDKYLHVWEGQTKQITDSCIFKGKFTIQNFETHPDIDFYFGADWGFSNDPTCLIRCYIHDQTLYIDYEAYGVGVDLDEIDQLFDSIPGSRNYYITADNSRPDTISYLKRKGFKMRESKKGKNSIEDGIEFIKSFKQVIIHERCKNTAYEFKSYSYKKDRLTDEILPIIIDKDNHTIDSIRYGLERVRRGIANVKPSNVSAFDLGL